jgi:hypothetical protein
LLIKESLIFPFLLSFPYNSQSPHNIQNLKGKQTIINAKKMYFILIRKIEDNQEEFFKEICGLEIGQSKYLFFLKTKIEESFDR